VLEIFVNEPSKLAAAVANVSLESFVKVRSELQQHSQGKLNARR
jgi:hypothetical protein